MTPGQRRVAMAAVVEIARTERDAAHAGRRARPTSAHALAGLLCGDSLRSLENSLSILARAGILVGRRGSGGGYVMAKPSKEITLADIELGLTVDEIAPWPPEILAMTIVRSYLTDAAGYRMKALRAWSLEDVLNVIPVPKKAA